jgi:hypothetical protein
LRLLAKISTYFLVLSLLLTCDKVDEKYKANVKLNITIKDDLGNLVTGLGTNDIFMLLSSNDYLDAFVQKTSSKGVLLNSFTPLGNGVYEFILDDPNLNYWIFINHKDVTRNFNLSNFGISGPLKKLPSRAIIYLELVIRPDDGNLVFYSTATNKMPIEVQVGLYDTIFINNLESKTINNTFSGTGIPDYQLENGISSVWFNRDPGKYSYYAKSNDGCVWTGTVVLEKGKSVPIDLSKCPSGKMSFYTTTVNSSILPIIVTINGQNLSPKEVNTLSGITVITSFDCSTTQNTGILTFIRSAGTYSYFASTVDGKCVWTDVIYHNHC